MLSNPQTCRQGPRTDVPSSSRRLQLRQCSRNAQQWQARARVPPPPPPGAVATNSPLLLNSSQGIILFYFSSSDDATSLQRAGSWDRLNNMLPPADASRVAAIIEKVCGLSRVPPRDVCVVAINPPHPPPPLPGVGGISPCWRSRRPGRFRRQLYGAQCSKCSLCCCSVDIRPPPPHPLPQLQAAPASVGMRGDDVRRVRAGGLAAAAGKSASMSATAPAAMGGVQGIGSASAAAAAEAAEPATRKSALPPGRRGAAMTKGAHEPARSLSCCKR